MVCLHIVTYVFRCLGVLDWFGIFQSKQSTVGGKQRPSLQNIGVHLGSQMSKSPKANSLRQKGLPGLRLKPIPAASRRSSVTTES